MNPRLSVVEIRTRDGEFLGSGFFTSKTTILSCRHVLDNEQRTLSAKDITVKWLGEDRRVEQCTQHPDRDVVCLTVKRPFSIEPEIIGWVLKPPIQEQQVQIFGFNNPDVYELEDLTRFVRGYAEDYDLDVLDQPVLGGFSGSPACVNNAFIGMVVAADEARTLLIPATDISAFAPEQIHEEHIPPRPPSLNNQTPPEVHFVGREGMRETIRGWYKSKDVRVGALIGWGGVGKSALVRKWYDELGANNIQPDGIFWWGFYRNAYLEQFLNALLRYVSGGQIEPERIKSTWEKAERIKEYIGQGTYLIILDGLEEMQKGQTSGEQFGCMEHRECADMLKFMSDTRGNGLCLISTRYPLTDIKNYEGKVYQKIEVERLSTEEARGLFEKVGVKGSREEIESVINEYDGHALSLTLLSKYLVEDFGGDIKKAKDIPPFYSDKEAGGKAHRILLWYAEQLTEEQSAFMKIFSLFRRAVREEDFEGVFRAKMETEMNQALAAMSEFAFKRMVDNLVDRRLISRDQDNTYATHPLIKNYFESIFDEDDKKLCHKRIYEYIGEYAPERADTLEEMQPLFEQVYHGCAAGLYDETRSDVYWEKIQRTKTSALSLNK